MSIRFKANELDEMIYHLNEKSICFCSYCPPGKKGINFGIALTRNIFEEYK